MILKDLTKAQQRRVLSWLEDLNRPKALDRLSFVDARAHLAFFAGHGSDVVMEKARQLLATFDSKLDSRISPIARREILDSQKISIDFSKWRPAGLRGSRWTKVEARKELHRILRDLDRVRRVVYLQTGIVLEHVHDVKVSFLNASGAKEMYRVTVNGLHSFALLVGQLSQEEVQGLLSQGYTPGREGLLGQIYQTNLLGDNGHLKDPYMIQSLVDGEESLVALRGLKSVSGSRYKHICAGFVRNIIQKLLTYSLRSGYAPILDNNFKVAVTEILEKPETVQLYEGGKGYSTERSMRYQTLK